MAHRSADAASTFAMAYPQRCTPVCYRYLTGLLVVRIPTLLDLRSFGMYSGWYHDSPVRGGKDGAFQIRFEQVAQKSLRILFGRRRVRISCQYKFYFCVSVHRSIGQIKHQLDATLCRFYFCRVTLHVLGVKRPSLGVLKNWLGGPWYRCSVKYITY